MTYMLVRHVMDALLSVWIAVKSNQYGLQTQVLAVFFEFGIVLVVDFTHLEGHLYQFPLHPHNYAPGLFGILFTSMLSGAIAHVIFQLTGIASLAFTLALWVGLAQGVGAAVGITVAFGQRAIRKAIIKSSGCFILALIDNVVLGPFLWIFIGVVTFAVVAVREEGRIIKELLGEAEEEKKEAEKKGGFKRPPREEDGGANSDAAALSDADTEDLEDLEDREEDLEIYGESVERRNRGAHRYDSQYDTHRRPRLR